MSVFVVEDDKAVRESLALYLRQMDLQPVAYATAEDFLREQNPHGEDTVLIDIGLPGMSGAELVRSLRQRENPPKIIIVSGKSQSALDRELSLAGDAVILRKPFEPDCLASALAQAR
ncbi:MAG: response regulator [Tepidamorphaceae bacterium]|nr:response regulator [Rhodobiaceae bacterium]MCC0050216.1 response regulator [Rhodobiaceae bacterium]